MWPIFSRFRNARPLIRPLRGHLLPAGEGRSRSASWSLAEVALRSAGSTASLPALPVSRRAGEGVIGLLLALLFGFLAPAALAADGVFIPRFFDPGRRIERPELGAGRTLRILTDDDYPPFHFLAPDGQLAGFDVDLARAICEELGVTCTVQARRWDTLVDALVEGQGDAVFAALAVTEAARRRVDFSLPYLRTPARFVVNDQKRWADPTPESWAGRVVAVEARTAHEAYLRAFFPALDIRPFDTQAAARSAIRSGAVDALFGDGVGLALWLNGADSDRCCRFSGGPFTESRWFGDGVGIAVRRGDAPLRRALDWALHRLAQKGLTAELYLKYFPVGFY
ncbi:MAG: transporter substrate-binding domain-containing protein [Methylobacteriaceae bacterium]|nr:transporter substrate-binding domain-containing protein [Methylobacteriaceae bacterium]